MNYQCKPISDAPQGEWMNEQMNRCKKIHARTN